MTAKKTLHHWVSGRETEAVKLRNMQTTNQLYNSATQRRRTFLLIPSSFTFKECHSQQTHFSGHWDWGVGRCLFPSRSEPVHTSQSNVPRFYKYIGSEFIEIHGVLTTCTSIHRNPFGGRKVSSTWRVPKSPSYKCTYGFIPRQRVGIFHVGP